MNKLMNKLAMMMVALLALAAFSGGVAFAHDLTVTLAGMNNSGQSGTVQILAQEDDTTKVVVTVTGAASGAQLSAGIYAGTCAAVGASFTQLNPVVNGESQTNLALDEHELTHGDKLVSLADATGKMTACVQLLAAHDEDEEAEEAVEHHEEVAASPGMPRTGAADLLPLTALAFAGALTLTGFGVALRRRSSI